MSGDIGREKRKRFERMMPQQSSEAARASRSQPGRGLLDITRPLERTKKEPSSEDRPLHQKNAGDVPESKDKELHRLLERAQPRLSDEAREVIARLEAWDPPLTNLPVDRAHFQLPEKLHPSISVPKEWKREEAQARLDRSVQEPGAGTTPPSPEVMRAYEQRCADIEQLWKLTHPQTYALLEKYNVTLKPRGALTVGVQLRNGDRVNRDFATGLNAVFTRLDDKKNALHIDMSLSPVEAIRQALWSLSMLENVDHHFAQGKKQYDGWMKWIPHFPYQRMVDVIELNYNLAEYGIAKRYNPVEKMYRKAYNQAIRDAYARGHLNSHTLGEELRALGQRAGRSAVAELRVPRRPGEQLFIDLHPSYLYTELKRAEALGIAPLKLDQPAFRAAVDQWAQEIPIGQTQVQDWIWTYTMDNELRALPRQFRSGDSFYFMTHTIVAEGKPVKTAGELHLEVTRMPDGKVDVQAKSISNYTGHYQVDAVSLYTLKKPVLEALRKAGITTEGVDVKDWDQ